MMREFYIRRVIGEDCLRIGVNARAIRYETRSFDAQEKRRRLRRLPYFPKRALPVMSILIFETSKFRFKEGEVSRSLLEETPIYLKMKDVFDNQDNLKASRTYEDIARALDKNGSYKHKNYLVETKDDIENCIRTCLLDIMLSMEKSGYLIDKKSKFATGGLGTAFIDRDGTILKAPGASHRLAAARIVGLKDPFPLRIIGAHADWLKSRGIRGIGDVKKLPSQIRLAEAENQSGCR